MADETVFSFRFKDETPGASNAPAAASSTASTTAAQDTGTVASHDTVQVLARGIADEIRALVEATGQQAKPQAASVTPPPLPKYVTPQVVDRKQDVLDAFKESQFGKPITQAEKFTTVIRTAANAVGGGTGSALGRLAVAGGIAAASITALSAASYAAVRRFNKSAGELQDFSGILATAFASSEVANIRQQIARANLNGAQLARFVDAQGKIERLGERVLTILERAGLELLLPALEPVAKIADFIEKQAQTKQGEAIQKAVADGVAFGMDSALNPLSALFSAAYRYFRGQNEKENEPDARLPYDEFLALVAEMRGGTY